jgi:glycosyltransferase involved in cell wall biosynthesis
VVDTHFALYGLVAMAAARLTRRPLIVHFHGPWAGESAAAGRRSRPAISLQRAIERAVYRRAERLVVLSEAFKELVVECYGVPAERVAVVPPAVDLERFSPGAREGAKERLGLVAADGPVAVTVRRLVRRMGLDDLLRAWSRLDPQNGTLLVAGTGPEGPRLEELAAELGVGHSVRFAGFVPEARLPDVYRAADLCVVPTRELEGFGLVALEALACGTPVLAADTGGLREALAGLGDDVLFPPRDHVALAERLSAALDGSRPLPSPEACRRHAERFSGERAVSYHMDLYDALAGPRPVGG